MSQRKLIEKTLASELVFQGRFIKVTRDQVELPDGQISHREYIQHPGAAVVLPVLESGEIILVEQYRHAMGRVFLELPAGKRDKGEAPEVTAVRELKEETGFIAKDLKFLTVIHPVIGYANEEMFLYLATGLTSGHQKLDQGEFLNVVQFSPESLKEMVRKGEITDVKTLIGLFWYWNFFRGEKV